MKAYGAGQKVCEKHGTQQIDWKCNFCCSVALFHCFGTTYFCNRCHNEHSNNVVRDCNGVNCPLGMPHPPASKDLSVSTFPLGCGICRSERLAEMKDNANLVQEVALPPTREEQMRRIAEEQKKAEEERIRRVKAEEEARQRRIRAEEEARQRRIRAEEEAR